MPSIDIAEILRKTISDNRISRGEKKLLQQLAREIDLEQHQLSLLKSQIFGIARQQLLSPDAKQVNEWVEDVLKAIEPRESKSVIQSEALFSPEEACALKIISLIDRARKQIDVCVFTITDNRISDALCRAHKRRVNVRVISDNDKSRDRGSDVDRLESMGIQVRTDNEPSHMHHKYALFDSNWLLTGSYNWTRSASTENEENIVVTNDPNLVSEFRDHFSNLWNRYA
jgi:phosphatidylserine/phosphatidylglycerophosphate/cardiolipin synthase-like enzyme